MFRCEDLEAYVKELDESKINILLLNKADYLTDEQRVTWANYFTKQNVTVAFFSAILEDEEEEEKDVSYYIWIHLVTLNTKLINPTGEI